MLQAVDVNNYRDLVKRMAFISFHNPGLDLFYRGQNNEYRDVDDGVTLHPSMYRNLATGKVRTRRLINRFKRLNTASDYLALEFKKSGFSGRTKLRDFEEIQWSVLQHYEVCATPLLDLTSSLRIASSFALNRSKYGYFYVVGLPRVQGSISYYVEEALLNVKLSSICPPRALRPHFQEGFVSGCFPAVKSSRRIARVDFSRRLVSVYKLSAATFWTSAFKRIPERDLRPKVDRVRTVCDRVKDKLSSDGA